MVARARWRRRHRGLCHESHEAEDRPLRVVELFAGESAAIKMTSCTSRCWTSRASFLTAASRRLSAAAPWPRAANRTSTELCKVGVLNLFHGSVRPSLVLSSGEHGACAATTAPTAPGTMRRHREDRRTRKFGWLPRSLAAIPVGSGFQRSAAAPTVDDADTVADRLRIESLGSAFACAAPKKTGRQLQSPAQALELARQSR